MNDNKDLNVSLDSNSEESRNVKIVLWGEGIRIDCYDDCGEIIECYNALYAGTTLFEIKIIDGDKVSEIKESDFGKTIGPVADDDPDFEKCDFENAGCNLWEPAEHGISVINSVQTKVYGEIEVPIPAGDKFNPAKARLLWSEFALPHSEEPIYFGMLCDGKQYPIVLDIDSEREISDDRIWEEED